MSKEAMKLALEALEKATRYGAGGFDEAKEALEEALAKQGQGEPVAKVGHDLEGHIGWNPNLTELPDEGVALYMATQQRTWVGLDEEDDIDWEEGGSLRDLVEAVEAKLKEKNG